MGIAVIAILALATAGAVVVLTLIVFTFIKLKELIRDRLKKSKVAFGNTKKAVHSNAKKILDAAPTMKMKDLEELSEDENEYFIVNYDEDTDEVTDFTTIRAEKVEEKVEKLLDDTDGIMVFE